MAPKISIIIPIYNVEKYLRECLDSIVNQTLGCVEILCVNDGSPDNSLKILEEYAEKDKRIKIINKENGGYASAINAGLEVAEGEFIQIVESDDFCDSHMCEDLYNKIKDTDADFITADFYFYRDGAKKPIKTFKYLKDEDAKIESFSLKSLPYIINRPAYPWKSLYRKTFLNKNNIKMLQDGNGCYEDQPWNATVLAFADKILYLNKPYYYYRVFAEGSSTNNGKRSMIKYICRRKQSLEILKENNLYNKEIEEHFCAAALSGCFFFFKKIAFEFKEEYYNEMKDFLVSIIEDKITFKYFSKKMQKRYYKIKNKDFKKFYATQIFINKIKKILKKGDI